MSSSKKIDIILLISFLSVVSICVYAVIPNSNKSHQVNDNASSSATNSSNSPLIQSGYFSAQTFAQQRALNEFESMKQDYPSNPLVGGSISPTLGSSVSYDPSLHCSAVVVKDFDSYKFNGVSKNINFFMDDGSQAIIVLDDMNHIKDAQINNQFSNVYGSCDLSYSNNISCIIRSSSGDMISGTRSNIISINAYIRGGATLSR